MRASLIGAIAGLLALTIAAPVATEAQTSLSAPAAPYFNAPQLDQLVAPVALYPDQLLGQILMAATYPLEVVEAERWLQDPRNAALHGAALADALSDQDWDPSVKALVPFPRVLQMMNDRLDWMQRLGDAFLGQQGDVMDAVQRLRSEALAAGTLAPTPQQSVTSDGQTVVIESVNPDMIYPPYYDPTQVYGPWPYPDYPPYYFPPPPDYVYGPPLFFGIGFVVIPTLWGWDRFDWHARSVHIDVDRYNRIDRQEIDRLHRTPIQQDTWQHDPYHRRGVAYRGPAAQAQFAKPLPAGSPDTRRPYRGYDNAVGATPRGTAPSGPAGRVSPGGAGVVGQPSAVPPAAVQQPERSRLPTGGRPAPVPGQPPGGRQQDQTRVPTAAQPAPVPGQPPGGRQPDQTRPLTAVQPAPVPGQPPGGRQQDQTRLPTAARPAPVPGQPPGGQQPAQTRLPTTERPAPVPPPVVQQPAQTRPPTVVQPQSVRVPPTIPQPAQTRQPTVIPAPAVTRPPPPAFEGITRGQDVRSQAARGQQSQQAPAPPRGGPAVGAAPAPHVAPVAPPARVAPPPAVAPQTSKPSGGGGPRGQNSPGAK
jgi:hypothetical protein